MYRSPFLTPICLGLLFVAGARAAASAQDEEQQSEEAVVYEGRDLKGNPLRVSVVEKTIGYADPSMSEESMKPSPDGRGVSYMVMAGSGLAIVRDGVQGEPYDAIHPDSLNYSPSGTYFGYAAMKGEVGMVVLNGLEYPGILSSAGFKFSEEGDRVGFVIQKRDIGKDIAVIDGEAGNEYDMIAGGGVLFSPGGAHYAYVAREGKASCVVLDGEEGPLFEDIIGIWFSSDGTKLAYIARQGDQWIPFYDGDPLGSFRKVTKQGFVFPTERNDHYAVAVVGDDHKCAILLDGKEHKRFDRLAHLMGLSPDGSRIAAVVGNKQENRLVVDDQELDEYDSYLSLSFSPDGKRFAYTARKGDKIVAVVDGEEGPEVDQILEPGVKFSPDGKRYIYMSVVEGKHVAVIDGETSEPIRRLGKRPLEFIPGGSRAIYSLKRQGKEVVVVDGVEGPEFDSVRNITFTPDGQRFAYAGNRGPAWFVVVDGKEEAAYPYLAKDSIRFSPDGKHVAYGAGRDQKNFLVVDGKEARRFDFVVPGSVTFTPDSKHVLCLAAIADQRYIVVDDVLLKGGWEGFLEGNVISFDGNNKFSIRGSRTGKLLRVEAEILP